MKSILLRVAKTGRGKPYSLEKVAAGVLVGAYYVQSWQWMMWCLHPAAAEESPLSNQWSN